MSQAFLMTFAVFDKCRLVVTYKRSAVVLDRGIPLPLHLFFYTALVDGKRAGLSPQLMLACDMELHRISDCTAG